MDNLPQFSKKKTLLLVVGPTAVGKTQMAITLANAFKTQILSADSRQFYREMSIGTAKPDTKELAAAPHHFINSHSLADTYSAGDYERDALVLLEQLFQVHDVVVMVGGSGLFIRAVCEGLDNLPKAPEAIREALNASLEANGLAYLQERLQAIDPEYYAGMDYANPQRVVRALEVYETTGKPIGYYQQQNVADRPFQSLTIGLNMDREKLYSRINARVDHMMEQGLLDEVRALIAFRDKPAMLTVGYAELYDYQDGNCTLEDAVAKIKQNSRRYAKRQLTWFKKYGNTNWYNPDDSEAILRFVQTQLTT